MAKTKKTSKGKIAVEIGAGILAAGAAAAAGYYFYGSKQAKKHRKIVVKWAGDMKKEVMREISGLKEINARSFAQAVDTVTGTYRGVRSINAADLKRAANELKSNWEVVQREIQPGISRAKVVGKRALARGKKTVKKIVKKASTTARKSR